MACEGYIEVADAVVAAIDKFRDLELFSDLDEWSLQHLLRLGDEGELDINARELRSVIEAHLRQPHADLTLFAPQSVEAFTSVIDVDVSQVFFSDPDPSIAHLVGRQYAKAVDDEAYLDSYTGTVMLEPESHHEWVGCYNQALAAVGDDRRFVAFDVADFEEPIYILVTDEQHAALADADLLAYNNDEVKMCGGLWASTRAERLAESLSLKRIAAVAAADEVMLALDLEASASLLDRLRADLHHDERVRVLVAEAFGHAVPDELGPELRSRLERLQALGLAPPLDPDVTEAALRRSSTRPGIAVAKVLYAHVQRIEHPRVLLGPDAIARASRANAELAGDARWHLVTMYDHEPFAVLLEAHEHAAIVAEQLLFLEPVPVLIAPPGSPSEVRDQLIALLGATPAEITLEPGEQGRFALRLVIRGAALLDQLAKYPR